MNRYIEDQLNQYILDKGVAISAISVKTGVPGNALYRSLRGDRKIRGDELIKVCGFLGINPMIFLPEKAS